MAIIGCIVGLPQEAQAAPADYPYAGTPCVHAPYAASGSRLGWCPDYDWGLRPGDESRASVISPYGYYYRNCTDYAAWWLAAHSVPGDIYRGLGDAKNWPRAAGAKGVRVDGTPSVGSVGVRTTGTYGHIAVVESVDVPGQPGAIRVSEYNRQGTGVYGERTGMPAQLGLAIFIHFDVFVVPPAAPAPLPPGPPVQDVVAIPAVTVPETPVPVATKDQGEAESADGSLDGPKTVPDVLPTLPEGEVGLMPAEAVGDDIPPETAPELEPASADPHGMAPTQLAASLSVLSLSDHDVGGGEQVSPDLESVSMAVDEPVPPDTLLLQRTEERPMTQDEVPTEVEVAERSALVMASPVYTMPPASIPVRWWASVQGSPPVLGRQAQLASAQAVPVHSTFVALGGLACVVLLSGLGWAAIWQWWLARWYMPATYRHLGVG